MLKMSVMVSPSSLNQSPQLAHGEWDVSAQVWPALRHTAGAVCVAQDRVQALQDIPRQGVCVHVCMHVCVYICVTAILQYWKMKFKSHLS